MWVIPRSLSKYPRKNLTSLPDRLTTDPPNLAARTGVARKKMRGPTGPGMGEGLLSWKGKQRRGTEKVASVARGRGPSRVGRGDGKGRAKGQARRAGSAYKREKRGPFGAASLGVLRETQKGPNRAKRTKENRTDKVCRARVCPKKEMKNNSGVNQMTPKRAGERKKHRQRKKFDWETKNSGKRDGIGEEKKGERRKTKE